jgi:hypothetical protein
MRIIDIDGHVREADDLWERYLESPFRDRAPKIQRVPNGQLLFLLEGNRYHRKPEKTPFEVKGERSPANPHRERAMDPKPASRHGPGGHRLWHAFSIGRTLPAIG